MFVDLSTGGVADRKTGADSGRMGGSNTWQAGIPETPHVCEVDLKPEARVIKPGGSVEIEVPQMGAKGSRWVKFQISF